MFPRIIPDAPKIGGYQDQGQRKMQRVPISMVEVEGNKANKNRKSIYVTVRVNPHVPGPMETRNRGRKVGRSKKITEKLATHYG